MWYAASYAEFVNQKIHDVTEEERKGPCLHLKNILFSPAMFSSVVLTNGFFLQCCESRRRIGHAMSVIGAS